MDILLTILAIITIGLLLIAIMMLMKIAKNKGNGRKQIAEVQKKVEILGKTAENQNRLMLEQLVRMNESLVYQVNNLGSELRRSNEAQQSKSVEVLEKIEAEMKALDRDNREGLEKLMTANFDSMEKLRRENSESLDKINNTVSEKLQKTLNDRISQSFESVNKRLTEVYAGLGEMKAVASGVSDLKKVLSNVKTRGIMGEIQLGAILAEILAPEQYEEQAAIIPDSSERVDFAVKLPGKENDSVYLPIDSKFPGDTYAKIAAAYESGNAVELKSARSALELEMKRCARSIRTKYVKPPYTTDFAIMFLPFEGLYAEVVNHGLVEILQREYNVNIAGPSTMAALLNSLQMGFRTLAIQKRTSEVWSVLGAVKTEFGKFGGMLEKVQKICYAKGWINNVVKNH